MHDLYGQLIPKRKNSETTLSIPRYSLKINQMTFCHSWKGIMKGKRSLKNPISTWKKRSEMGRTILSIISESCSLSTTCHSHPAMCQALKSRIMIRGGEICEVYQYILAMGQGSVFSNIILHTNHPGILLDCRFWFSRCGVGPKSPDSKKLQEMMLKDTF